MSYSLQTVLWINDSIHKFRCFRKRYFFYRHSMRLHRWRNKFGLVGQALKIHPFSNPPHSYFRLWGLLLQQLVTLPFFPHFSLTFIYGCEKHLAPTVLPPVWDRILIKNIPSCHLISILGHIKFCLYAGPPTKGLDYQKLATIVYVIWAMSERWMILQSISTEKFLPGIWAYTLIESINMIPTSTILSVIEFLTHVSMLE